MKNTEIDNKSELRILIWVACFESDSNKDATYFQHYISLWNAAVCGMNVNEVLYVRSIPVRILDWKLKSGYTLNHWTPPFNLSYKPQQHKN